MIPSRQTQHMDHSSSFSSLDELIFLHTLYCNSHIKHPRRDSNQPTAKSRGINTRTPWPVAPPIMWIYIYNNPRWTGQCSTTTSWMRFQLICDMYKQWVDTLHCRPPFRYIKKSFLENVLLENWPTHFYKRIISVSLPASSSGIYVVQSQ